jgi:hypothetical protein
LPPRAGSWELAPTTTAGNEKRVREVTGSEGQPTRAGHDLALEKRDGKMDVKCLSPNLDKDIKQARLASEAWTGKIAPYQTSEIGPGGLAGQN